MEILKEANDAISGHLRINLDQLYSPKSRKYQVKRISSSVFHSDILLNSVPLIKLVAYAKQEGKTERGFLTKVNFQRPNYYRIMTKEDKMKLGFNQGKSIHRTPIKEITKDQRDSISKQSPIFQNCCERAPGDIKEESPFTNDTVIGILAQRSVSAIRERSLNK
jgi:hypothetical protein